MQVGTEIVVWRVICFLVSYGAAIIGLFIPEAGVLMSLIGMFPGYLLTVLLEPGYRGWGWAAVVLNSIVFLIGMQALS